MITLITGGMRSGKSNLAEVQAFSDQKPLYYIATAQAFDAEMCTRISLHKANRSSQWQVIEAPINITQALIECPAPANILIDCMTLWLTNCLFDAQTNWPVIKQDFLTYLEGTPHNIWIVTNEIGSGVIPLGEINRNFVDEAGWLNQALAAIADDVYLCVSGIPLHIKHTLDDDSEPQQTTE